MELRQLRYFLATVKHGSVNRAAAALNVTQPALSHSLKALERSVGAELLSRSARGVQLTPLGRKFEGYARIIVREADKARGELAAMRGLGGESLVMGMLSVFAANIAPKVLSEYLARGKDVRVDISVFTAGHREIVERLRRCEWDLVLGIIGPDETRADDITIRPLCSLKSSVYCSPHHPLAAKAGVDLESMANFDWIVTTLGWAETYLFTAYEDQSAKPNIRVRVDSMDFVAHLAMRHPLLCFLPTVAAAPYIRSGDLVAVDQTNLVQANSVAVYYSNMIERTRAMRTMVTLLSKALTDAET